MRYRSKPSEIDAIQWLGTNGAEVVAFAPGKVALPNPPDTSTLLIIAGVGGQQGWVPVSLGDWLGRNPDESDLWPIEAARFAAKYEPILALPRTTTGD